MRVMVLADEDFEDAELFDPVSRFREEGWDVNVAGRRQDEEVEGKRGGTVRTDVAVGDVDATDFDVLLVPGGYAPDKMRTYGPFVEVARNAMRQGRLVAAICHGPQLLIEAGVVDGRRLTAWPSVWTDLRNAGADVVDQEVVVDDNLITSRKPADIPAFASAVVEAATARHGVTLDR